MIKKPICTIDDKIGYLDHLARVGCDLRSSAREGAGRRLLVDGTTADEAGSLALRELATERGMAVQIVGKSEWHEGVTYEPRAASGMEAATAGETTKIGSTEGDSPTAESGDAQRTPHD